LTLPTAEAECIAIEARAEWLLAAHRWLELAATHAVHERWAEAEHAARRACVCAERYGDECGRKVPSPNQRRGSA
jgi:hypothetical protein